MCQLQDVLHIAHWRLSANRALARALRLRLLSEAVQEEVDEEHVDVASILAVPGRSAEPGQSGELPVELLLREMLPFVSPAARNRTDCSGVEYMKSRGSALLHRLLWLIDMQLQNTQTGSNGEGGEGSEGRGDSMVPGVAVWNADRFCQRLQRLPVCMVKVEKIASRFMLLQADALAPCPLEEGGLPESWRDAQTRIDITNPLRRFESVLVLDERHNALVVSKALLHLLPVMLSKLADSFNR